MKLLGFLGALALALCGVPQAFKALKEGNSRGLSAGMLGLWLFGDAALLAYVATCRPDGFLLANYGFNLLVILVLCWYKMWPRK